mgnify:CR=1 FL=1
MHQKPSLILIFSALAVLLITTNARAQEFTKVSNSGSILPASAPPGDGPNDWACTRDNKTGLMWEAKTQSGLRAFSHTYSWRSGATGNSGNFASCENTLAPSRCNTAAYVARVNSQGLCGSTNWRMPGGNYRTGFAGSSPNGELAVFYQNAFATPGVDPTEWFPGNVEFWYWTGVRDSFNFGRVWAVKFDSGQVFSNFWDFKYFVRLVTTDQPSSPGPGPGPDPGPEPEQPPPPTLDNIDPLFGDDFELISRQSFNNFVPEALVGWGTINLSAPEGEKNWGRGDDTLFEAFNGASNRYWAANYEATTGVGTISAWTLSPVVEFHGGSKISFFSRSADSSAFPDRLEIRACTKLPCNSFPVDEFAVGDYDVPIASINPNLQSASDPKGIDGFPNQWTRFEFGATRGVPQSGLGRIAFRYFVTDGGPEGQNSFYVGLDEVRIHATPTDPPGIWSFILAPDEVQRADNVVIFYSTARASGCEATGSETILQNTKWNGHQPTGTNQARLIETDAIMPGSYSIGLRCFNRKGEEATAEAVLTVNEPAAD